MKTQFVNISKLAEKDRAEALTLSPPPEYIALRTAIERILTFVQSHKVCGACFAGKLVPDRKGRGCCGDCPALSTTGCTSKPVKCASYIRCEHMSELMGYPYDAYRGGDEDKKRYKESLACAMHKLDRLITGLRDHYSVRYYWVPDYFIGAYIRDSKHEYTPNQMRRLRRLVRIANCIADRAEAGYYKVGSPEVIIEKYAVLAAKREQQRREYEERYRRERSDNRVYHRDSLGRFAPAA
jgi:hypothetical protein